MNRRNIMQIVAGIVTQGLCSSALAETPVKDNPNIVVLLADDAGYSDFSCYGSKNINTPHIDTLAEEGIRFTDFYAIKHGGMSGFQIFVQCDIPGSRLFVYCSG